MALRMGFAVTARHWVATAEELAARTASTSAGRTGHLIVIVTAATEERVKPDEHSKAVPCSRRCP